MMLENKTILIMGIRNKWSIAYGIAKSAYENGAKLIFTYMGEDNKEKIEELISDFKGSKAYVLDGASEDELVQKVFIQIKEENGKIDGLVHAIAHANTEDLHQDFIYTSKEGYSHALDVSAYSFVLAARMAKEVDLLNENASLVTLTYHGSTKVLDGYNVMGAAKAALEASVRYLAENLGKEGKRVNAISAGPIKTLSAKGIKDFSSILTVVEEKSPLHRNVTTTQVGNVAAFLLSEISDLQIPEFDDSGTAAGITSFPTFLQKVKSKMNIFEFYRNFKAGMQYVLHAGQIVNNCASDAADLPLAAAQGKALWDQITRLNSEKLTFNMKRISGAHRCDAPNTYEYTGTSIVVPPCKFYIAIGHLGWSMGKPTGIVLAGSANSISNGELTDVLESDLLNTRYVYHIGVDGNIALYLWERRASIPDETTLNSNSIVVLYFT